MNSKKQHRPGWVSTILAILLICAVIRIALDVRKNNPPTGQTFSQKSEPPGSTNDIAARTWNALNIKQGYTKYSDIQAVNWRTKFGSKLTPTQLINIDEAKQLVVQIHGLMNERLPGIGRFTNLTVLPIVERIAFRNSAGNTTYVRHLFETKTNTVFLLQEITDHAALAAVMLNDLAVKGRFDGSDSSTVLSIENVDAGAATKFCEIGQSYSSLYIRAEIKQPTKDDPSMLGKFQRWHAEFTAALQYFGGSNTLSLAAANAALKK